VFSCGTDNFADKVKLTVDEEDDSILVDGDAVQGFSIVQGDTFIKSIRTEVVRILLMHDTDLDRHLGWA